MVGRVLALTAVLVLGVAAGAMADPAYIPLVQPGDAIPAIPLTAQDGRKFTLPLLRGNAVAVAFVYTRCGDARMCPLVAAKFRRVQAAIGSQPIRLLMLTLDPAFDTPAVLARYGRTFGQDPRRWILATGTAAATNEFSARFGIATSIAEPGVILHTEGLMIVGPDGRFARAIYGNDWTPSDLIDAARETLPGQRPSALMGLRVWLRSALERCGSGNVALGGIAMLGILALACASVGTLFWLAFRGKSHHDAATHP